MRKIAIANRKGGVGKTTTAVHIAAGLALAGKATLLIETDTQSQCAKHLGIQPLIGLAALILDGEDAVMTARAKLDVLAGGMELAAADREISIRELAVEYALTEAMQPIEDRYEYIIIDGAPGFSRLSVNALVYADEIICPVSLEGLAVHGLVNFLGEIRKISDHAGTVLSHVLPTFFDKRVGQTDDFHAQLLDHVGDLLLDPIPYSVAVSEAAARGQTVYEYRKRDRASYQYIKTAEGILGERQSA